MRKYDVENVETALSREQVRSFDNWVIESLKVPSAVLMENAGRGCAEAVIESLCKEGGKDVVIICGKGNNGGDGYVAARHLYNTGFNPITVVFSEKDKIKGDARTNLEILENMGLELRFVDKGSDFSAELKDVLSGADVVVDALLGTGISGQLKEEYAELVELINQSSKPVVAVDIPSGLDCDSGLPLGSAVKAQKTVTFAAVKKGFLQEQAKEYTGQVYLVSIGVEPVLMKNRGLG